MARYIDADKFIERIKVSPAFPNMGMDGFFLRDVVCNLLDNMPTADVAPRSEVAREIVEFLFRRSKVLQQVFKDDLNSAQCFRGRFELENAAVIIANEYNVELKKYTEGKTNEKDT